MDFKKIELAFIVRYQYIFAEDYWKTMFPVHFRTKVFA